MADIKKFLDQGGVSTLWTRIAEEVAKVDAKAADNAADILAHGTRLDAAEKAIEALEAGTYDDSELRGLIADNKTAHEANAAAITTLNGGAEVVGSVTNTANAAAAAKVAEIVAGANADFDTLKEIADWILNDTTGAADMANDIAALQGQMAGIESTVVAAIASAIEAALKIEGVDKYALASELTSLAGRVKTLEDANLDNRVKALEDMFGGAEGTVEDLIADAKAEAISTAAGDATTKANNAETAAKAYADGLAVNYATAAQGAKADTALQVASITTGSANGAIAVNGTDVAVKGLGSAAYTDASAYDAAGAAATAAGQALADAKAYTDTEINTKVIALTTAEIEAAIAAATQG